MNALVDQGSDVNVMPFSTYMKLTDERPAETDIRLSLASHSYIYPLGIADDILVEVAKHVYPVFFMILDIKEDEKRPFILGTPFLTRAKAVIKFDKGIITLRYEKSKISFHKIPESLCKIERGVKNDIDPISPTITVNRLVLKWEERIKLHLEREMKFDQWKSKNFKSKHHALVKVEGEMDNKAEVTIAGGGGIERGFLSQKGSGGRGVKEKDLIRSKNNTSLGIGVSTNLEDTINDDTLVGVAFAIQEGVTPYVVGMTVEMGNNAPGKSSYANITGKPYGKKVNVRTLFTPGGNGIDVVVPVDSIRAISERFANAAYGFFLGKKVAYRVVANYVRNT
ncbi:reverse transcriptase domain-containing protein [Tanacetum coccineum]